MIVMQILNYHIRLFHRGLVFFYYGYLLKPLCVNDGTETAIYNFNFKISIFVWNSELLHICIEWTQFHIISPLIFWDIVRIWKLVSAGNRQHHQNIKRNSACLKHHKDCIFMFSANLMTGNDHHGRLAIYLLFILCPIVSQKSVFLIKVSGPFFVADYGSFW